MISQSGQGDRSFDRLPPAALEAECAVLGSMILDQHVIGDVATVIGGPDDFYKGAHGIIYQTLLDMYDRQQPIDMVQLNQVLKDRKVLADIGGTDYLMELAESVPSSASALYYAKIVHEKGLLRRLIDCHTQGIKNAYEHAGKVDELIDQAEAAIFELSDNRNQNEAITLAKELQKAIERARDDSSRGKLTGVPSGFLDLDETTNGLQPGEMIIVAARPSMGKTALALCMLEHMAVMQRIPVAMFSMEMSREQLCDRLVSMRAGVPLQSIRRNMLCREQVDAMAEAVDQLVQAPLYVDDTPGLTPMQLRTAARRFVAKQGIQAVFVDYLQLMACPGSENRRVEVGNISRAIKGLARELKIPVIALCQLNRASEQRENRRPRMAELRESGDLEQDADTIILLHREERCHIGEENWAAEHPDEVGLAELIIEKQRQGPTNTVKLHFDDRSARFCNRQRPF